MRSCPVCLNKSRHSIFSTPFTPPDLWTLPHMIDWHSCEQCGMIYGDGDMTQSMFDEYYSTKYGYGLNNPQNVQRLKDDAKMIHEMWLESGKFENFDVVDFGGGGDDGSSIIVRELGKRGFWNAKCIGVNQDIPACDVIYASHVIEHIYDLPNTMSLISEALRSGGTLIIDVPDATGLLNRWKMPILDFNTKHLNHFTLRTILDLCDKWWFESVLVKPYELEFAPCYQVHFKKLDLAQLSAEHIKRNINERVKKLRAIDFPVNVWGMSDIVWVLLSHVNLDVLNYIDNDPAYRGATYKGKMVVERPFNAAPIVIMAQGQRKRLIENIRNAGFTNEIIEV